MTFKKLIKYILVLLILLVIVGVTHTFGAPFLPIFAIEVVYTITGIIAVTIVLNIIL